MILRSDLTLPLHTTTDEAFVAAQEALKPYSRAFTLVDPASQRGLRNMKERVTDGLELEGSTFATYAIVSLPIVVASIEALDTQYGQKEQTQWRRADHG